MSESMSRPPVLRHRSQVPGSFNTDDELSPIKTSFDDDEPHSALLPESSSPGPAPFSNDISLQLPEHDDMSGGYFGNQAMDDTDDKMINVVDGDSSLSMIASHAVSTVDSGGNALPDHEDSSPKHSSTDTSTHVAENPSPQLQTQNEIVRDSTKTSTMPSSRVLPAFPPPKDLAYTSPTPSSKLSTQPPVLAAQPLYSANRLHSPSSTHSHSSSTHTTIFHARHSRSESWKQPTRSPATSPSLYQTPATVRSSSSRASLTSLGGYETAEEQGTSSPSLSTLQVTTHSEPSTPKLSHRRHPSSPKSRHRHQSSTPELSHRHQETPSPPGTPTPTKSTRRPSNKTSQNQVTKSAKMCTPQELNRIIAKYVPITPVPLPHDPISLSDSDDDLSVWTDGYSAPKINSAGERVDTTPNKHQNASTDDELVQTDELEAMSEITHISSKHGDTDELEATSEVTQSSGRRVDMDELEAMSEATHISGKLVQTDELKRTSEVTRISAKPVGTDELEAFNETTHISAKPAAGPSRKFNGKRLAVKDLPKIDPLPSSGLPVRDHNTALDRVMKDNFDLKMRISYLQRLMDQMDDEEVKKIIKQNTELQSEKIQSAKAAREMKRSIRDLEAKLMTSETETNRLKLEHKTTIIQTRDRIIELEQELVETLSEVTQLQRQSSNARSRSNSTKNRKIKELTKNNTDLLQEVRAQTSMLTSRNRERELLTQQVEDLKFRLQEREELREDLTQKFEELKVDLQKHKRSSSNGSSVTKSDRDHYEDRIGNLRDELSALKLAELKATKHLQAKREECDELHIIANHLDKKLVEKGDTIENLGETVKALEKEAEKLRNEVRMLDNGIAHIEADCQAKIRRIEELETENDDMGHELESIEKALVDANGKVQKLTIELESRQGECAFLREEQDGTMLKIGALEASLKTTETTLTSQKQRANEAEGRLADLEDSLRKTINNPTADKTTIITTITTLRNELETSTAQLTQTREILSKQEQDSKTTIQQIESTLQSEQSNATTLATRITELQKVLDKSTTDSDKLRTILSETEQLLNHRSALLETNGLETRRLTDLVEKERQGRRQDKVQYEQWQRSHQHTSRTVTQKDVRINELETARANDRKKFTTLEEQLKHQVSDRNQLLLAMWHRLSTICGTDWQHQNSLVNGHLPTYEVVNSMLHPFSHKLLLSVKTIENIVGGFKSRLRGMEQAFARDFEALERNLEMRSKRLERLEAQVSANRTSNTFRPPPRIDPKASRTEISATLARHYSTTVIETMERQREQALKDAAATKDAAAAVATKSSEPIEPSQQRWIHRLRDLERRLKAEREARLMDRSGARKRLEEGKAENEALRLELERERGRRGE